MTIPWDMPPYEDEVGTDGSDSSNGAAAPDTPPMPTADQLNIPPEAWGIHQMLPHLDTVDDIPDIGWTEAATANATRVDELHNTYLDRQHELMHSGPDTFLVAPEVHSKLDALCEEPLGCTTNVLQRKTPGEMLDEARIVNHSDVGWLFGKPSLAWRKAVHARRFDQLRRWAALNHGMPGAVETWADLAEPAAREHARLVGLGKDEPEAGEFVAGTRSDLYRATIEAAVAKGNRRAAIRLYNQVRYQLAPEHAEYLKQSVTEARLDAVAGRYVGKLRALSPDIATVGEAEQAQEAATKQNDVDWKDHEARRETNQFCGTCSKHT